MIHKPIQIKNLGHCLPHKECFTNFSTQIYYGNRIAIIGTNGAGKTSLLKILTGNIEPTNGSVHHSNDVTFGIVPQIIDGLNNLSGAQRLNNEITKALSLHPNVLLLDEPTNHLDLHNRKSLMRMLKSYLGTLIVVSHDTEFLTHCVDTLWHIDGGKIHMFSGSYDDYVQKIGQQRDSIALTLSRLERKKHEMHNKLMKEQERAAKSSASGEKKIANRKWLKMVGHLKGMKAEKSQGKKLKAIDDQKNDLFDKLKDLRLPEVIKPKFSITAEDIRQKTILSIIDGKVGYKNRDPLLKEINVTMTSKDRIAILGDNASGKSTLVKAILNDDRVIKTGEWTAPNLAAIGYLDQHYQTLDTAKTVYETIAALVSNWSYAQVRCHLNDFLFRKNEEINLKINQLSGGEKARLCLAQLAAKTPKLLILDELTNNLDLETKEHVVGVLKNYPGALLVISHDGDFLKNIGVQQWYKIANGKLLKEE